MERASDRRDIILVVALGNRLAGDDGFGGWVADALRVGQPSECSLQDLTGASPLALLDLLEGQKGLILVDAVVDAQRPVGALVDATWAETARLVLAHDLVCSTHGLSLSDALGLASRLAILPTRVRVVGGVARALGVGEAATPEMIQAVPAAARRVRQWVARWSRETSDAGRQT
jgi:hydrogenase maturation protease